MSWRERLALQTLLERSGKYFLGTVVHSERYTGTEATDVNGAAVDHVLMNTTCG